MGLLEVIYAVCNNGKLVCAKVIHQHYVTPTTAYIITRQCCWTQFAACCYLPTSSGYGIFLFHVYGQCESLPALLTENCSL